jgi:hypothetical protein
MSCKVVEISIVSEELTAFSFRVEGALPIYSLSSIIKMEATFLQNISKFLPDYTVSHLRR